LLLIGAGLLINSFLRLQRTNPGVVIDQVLTAEINLPDTQYRDAGRAEAFYVELTQRLSALPGVQAASTSTQQPLGGSFSNDPFAIEGRALDPAALTTAGWQIVGADYFRTLGISLLKGRDITTQDLDESSPKVAVISEKMANRYWPGENPIGQRLTLGVPHPNNPWISIVGIAKDVPHRLDSPSQPDWYLSRTGGIQLNRYLLVRSTAPVSTITSAIRKEVRSLDRNLPITSFRTISEVISHTTAARKFNTLLLGLFAGLALCLATLGIYSVISYSVAMRTQEIGIRMALGAGKANVLKLVLKRGMMPALIGMSIGLIAALGLTRLMSGLLFGVTPTDELTYVLVSIFSLASVFLACYVPAKRATRVDPLVALRYE
jgi:putative ABC transport system permease protein